LKGGENMEKKIINKKHTFQLNISEQLFRELEKESKALEISVSAYIRDILKKRNK
jgi:hypothetical protein